MRFPTDFPPSVVPPLFEEAPMEAASTPHDVIVPRLGIGTWVLVRNSLNLWSSGFQVSGWRDGNYEVRRNSDGAVLPRAFRIDELRAQ